MDAFSSTSNLDVSIGSIWCVNGGHRLTHLNFGFVIGFTVSSGFNSNSKQRKLYLELF